jgi:predicted glycosyltransferase
MIVTGSRTVKMPDLEIEGVTIVDLPSAKGNFSSGAVTTSTGLSIQKDINWQLEYIGILLRELNSFQPNSIITEFWPIRRGVYDFAMIPFIAAATSLETKPSLYCLVRDYVHMSVTNSPHANSDTKTVDLLNRHYTAVLIHTHQSLMKLEESFPEAPSISVPVEYVGYIANTSSEKPTQALNRDTIIVTSGGGWMSYCEETTIASINAAEKHNTNDVWRIFVAHDIPDETLEQLQALASEKSRFDDHIAVEKNIPKKDFDLLLQKASAAIVHAGNTIIDAINYAVPTIIALPRVEKGVLKEALIDGNPFWHTAEGSTVNEQLIRAIRFGNAGYITVAGPEDLEKLHELIVTPHNRNSGIHSAKELLNGAANAATIVSQSLFIEA